jgi:hypothetical protein
MANHFTGNLVQALGFHARKRILRNLCQLLRLGQTPIHNLIAR